MTDFPLLSNALRNPARLQQAIAAGRAAVACGTIGNPLFNDLKSTVNRSLEKAWRTAIDDRFVYAGQYEQLPPPVREFELAFGTAPELHNIAGKLRRVEATPLDHPMITAMRAFLTEAMTLVTLFDALKPLVVKRQPKPVEDRRARYDAPSASRAAIGVVKALLEEITAASYAELKSRRVDYKRSLLTDFLEAQKCARLAGKTLPLRAFYDISNRRAQNYHPEAYDVVSRLTISHATGWMMARPDADALIEQTAIQEADDIRDSFVYKNLAKLDSILEAKGDFLRGEVTGQQIELGALRGGLRFFFADGATFSVLNSVVWSVSLHGRQFNRFPLTFHDVYLADGSKMIRPSEAKMNTVFVGKAELAA